MPAPDSKSTGLCAWRDIRRIAVLAGGGLFAQFVPVRASPFVTRLAHRAYGVLGARTVRDLEDKIRKALPADTHPDASAIAQQHILMRLEDIWGLLRGMRRFGWRPEIEWEGREQLDEALREGRGIVLWNMRFTSSTATKQGFYREGLPLVHLSRTNHGCSTHTRLGLGVVAPFHCRSENCYLEERIQIPSGKSLNYVQRLRERLRDGSLVSIFGEHEGRQNYDGLLFGAERKIALGAPSLAWLEDAALFTVAPMRVGPFRYRIVIDEAIPVDRDVPRRKFAELAAQEYLRRLEARILQHPADWQGWFYREF